MYDLPLKAMKIKQPIGEFYVAKISAKDLLEIAKADIREMSSEIDDYLGIQRNINTKRVEQINAFISNVDATFPNAIILSTDYENAIWNELSSTINLSCEEEDKYGLVRILDGQHRLAGFDEKNVEFWDADKKCYVPFELMIVLFVGSDIATQANVFATVNLAQTKVNKSLVYDLEAYANSRSPEKTCHDIVVILNSDKNEEEEGPFYSRIKRLGVKSKPGQDEVITQAAIVENLLSLISPIPKKDRNLFQKEKKNYSVFLVQVMKLSL